MDQSVGITGLIAAGAIGKSVVDRLFEKDGLVCKLVGPAVEELSQTLADGRRLFRVRRQLEGLQKTQDFLREANISPRAVSLKLLFPLLEFVSIEQDDDLHTKWAALLANAADPHQNEVSPANVDVLRQLTSREALFLDSCFNFVTSCRLGEREWIEAENESIGDVSVLARVYGDAGLTRLGWRQLITNGPHQEAKEFKGDWSNLRIDLDSLLRHRVLFERVNTTYSAFHGLPQFGQSFPTKSGYHMTIFGYRFVKLCRAPKANRKEDASLPTSR